MLRANPSAAGCVIALLVLSSCGSGTGAIAALWGNRRAGGGSSPTTVADVLVVGTPKRSPLQFSFRLTDANASPADVAVFYVRGTGAPVPLLLVGDTRLAALATSSSGTVHVRSWDFADQLPAGAALTPDVRLEVAVRSTGSQGASAVFGVGNDAPSVLVTGQPPTEVSGPIRIDLLIADSSADLTSVVVEYDRIGDARGWLPATPLGSSLGSVAAVPAGTPEFFLWDVTRDEPSAEFACLLRFTPSDGVDQGVTVQTAMLAVDNNAAPIGLVSGSAFVADPDGRRGIPAPFEVQDPEGDPVTLVWQWRTANGSFPTLPSDPGQVAAILADPDQRLLYQIATAFPTAERGVLVPIGPASARVPELANGGSLVQSEFVVGRTLQVLRGEQIPAPVTPTWTSNPLAAPVAALAVGSGESVRVLERPASGQWRLREVRLADGAIVSAIASGTQGGADALATFPDGKALLVAVSQAGIWKLLRVALPSGVVTTWYTTSGSNAVGSVRGLALPMATAAVVTVASALIRIDMRIPATPVETVVRSGLATPAGVAIDSRNPGLAYVAERDWVNPATSNPEGRLFAIELGAGSLHTLAVSGAGAPRPSSIALSADRASLWFVTDESPGNGIVEVRSVRHHGGGGGPSFTLVTGLADSAAGITSGPDGLLLVCDPAQSELVVGGGIEQSRAITAFDPASGQVTVASAFAPALVPGDRWQIGQSESLPAGASTRRGTFAWDSADAPAGQDIVLQVKPYDTDPGVATNTGVPRPVRTGLQVVPQLVGSLPANNGIRAIRLADLNGDGLADLVTANRVQNTLSVFFQTSPGLFPATASRTISSAFLTGPNDLVILDADNDGDSDIVSANGGSNNLTVVLQSTPSNFTVVPLLSPAANAPSALATGDLNGDGRDDIVCANLGSSDIRVFFQLPAGLYNTSADRTLTDPSAVAPTDVELADLDGDGDLDIVSCNESSDTVTIYRQTAPGVFAQPASSVLGGPGVTDTPVAIVLWDFDGDGRIDIAVASRDGNRICLFTQLANGSFPPAPTAVLSSPSGPIQPLSMTAADVDGDGAGDLIVTDTANNALAFFYDPLVGAFELKPQVLNGGAVLARPTSCLTNDLDGDGRRDLALANESAGNAAVFLQASPGSFRGQLPSTTLGGALATPGVTAVATADVDGDADLDLVCANAANGTLAVYMQLAPALFASDPALVLGDASTAGVASLVAADLNGDGRTDLASANATAGTLTVFFRAAGGGYSTTPNIVIGAGTLQQPVHVTSADTDGDGDMDLVCADAVANRVFVFAQQSPGVFALAPTLTLGTNTGTQAPNTVMAMDLDRDGDVDIACSCSGSSNIAVFFQTAPGVFAAVPDRSLGGAGTTNQARGLLSVRLNADSLPDLICASSPGNSVAVFLATAAGTWPLAPSATLIGGEIQAPAALGAGDLDGDGAPDLVVGNHGTDKLASLVQLGDGTFVAPAVGFGAVGSTDNASQVLVVDLDRDGDLDVISVHPDLDSIAVFFNAH